MSARIDVTVIATRGSSPREPGAQLRVWQDRTAGTVGGGALEWEATALARQMLIPDRPIEVTFREVRREVVELTGGEQVPWDSSSLLDTFNFSRTR